MKTTAQCKTCNRIFADGKWMFGKMSIRLNHLPQVECTECVNRGVVLNKCP